MKVLHVIPSIAARYGGPSEAVIHLCRALVAGGVSVDLTYTTARAEESEFRSTAREMVSSTFSVIELPRLTSERFKYAPRFTQWIGDRAVDYDLVHIHGIFSHTSISAARAARTCGRPYILRPLGNLSPFSLRRSALPKKIFMALGGGDLVRQSAAVHCTSAEEASDVQRAFAVRRTFVVPNGVDEAIFETGGQEREKIVLFLGRLDRKKNVGTLIDAFDRVNDPQWRLMIAGEGEREEELRRLARRSRARIEFTGWIDAKEKRRLLSRASLFSLPSSDENFGIAAAEAMAAGLPVIVSPQVNLAETVASSDAGWVTEAEPEPLASTLREAMADSEAVRAKGANARRAAERHFRWRQIGEELISIYGELSGRA